MIIVPYRGNFGFVVDEVADVEREGFVRRKLHLHRPNTGRLATSANVDPTFALHLTQSTQLNQLTRAHGQAEFRKKSYYTSRKTHCSLP